MRPNLQCAVMIGTEISCTLKRNHVRINPAAISCGNVGPGRLNAKLLQHLDPHAHPASMTRQRDRALWSRSDRS